MTATIAYRCPMSSTEPDHSSKFVAALASVGGFVGGAWGWLRARENRARAQAEMQSELMRRLGSLESRVDAKESLVQQLTQQIDSLERTVVSLKSELAQKDVDSRHRDDEQQLQLDHLKAELEIAKGERDAAIAELSLLNSRMNAEEKR